MANEPNWHKHVAIGTYVIIAFTAVLILLGILSFVHPPDPAHPMSLDFLSKSITISPWIAITVALGLVVVTAIVVRRRVHNSLPIAALSSNSAFVKENDELKRQVADLNIRLRTRSREKSPPRPVTSEAHSQPIGHPTFDSELDSLILGSKEGVYLQVTRTIRDNFLGILISVANGTDDWIGAFSLTVVDATNWSAQHNRFIPSRGFPKRALEGGKELRPLERSADQWLIRVMTDKQPQLPLLGNDDNSPLIWPNNDQSPVEIWRLSLTLSHMAHPEKQQSVVLPTFMLIVQWDRTENTLAMKPFALEGFAADMGKLARAQQSKT